MRDKIKDKTVRFLRWSQQYTKTDMLYLAKGGSWLTLEKTLTTLAGIGLAIAFANLIPEDTFGVYKYILSVAGIIGSLTLSGLKSAVIQSVAKGYEGSLRYGFRETLKWSSLMVVAAIGGSLYYFLQDNNTLALGVLMIGLFYPFLSSSALYNSFLEGKKDFKRRSLFMILREVLQAVVMIGVILLTQNILWILLAFFVVNCVPALLLYIRTLDIYEPGDKEDPELVNYGKHLSVINILGSVAQHIDKVLVFTFLGAGELAIYAFATLPVDRLQDLRGVLRSLALPKFSNTNLSILQKTLPRKLLLFFAGLLLLTAGFIFAAPYIYELIFPQYLESVRFAQIFSVSLLFMPGMILTNVLIGHAKKKELYAVNITTDVVKILLLLILLPTYGILGGIIALLADRALRAAIPTYFVFRG